MNGIDLDINILKKNLAFIREEITRVTVIKEQLETGPGARSDDAIKIIKTYGEVLSNLRALLRYEYDAESEW
ncbi:MAG: hypothetical protein MSA19_01930 [Butyricimonas virosa]|jgi:hypothetical protein|uniref:hypothetical protein n=1 Tax=Butyricimonas virosa TaxID=544645 RepID=UPI0020517541|nr:hypothetical protein [Butyricimonas virosa]MCI7162143.1 hypothetical protein [Butyricimonas virosa]MDY5013778.1 hypothetical protein [Butyricimonas virosa]DAP17252.1 MAG TPA: hypothetical protein [Caudoviricetes sp.]